MKKVLLRTICSISFAAVLFSTLSINAKPSDVRPGFISLNDAVLNSKSLSDATSRRSVVSINKINRLVYKPVQKSFRPGEARVSSMDNYQNKIAFDTFSTRTCPTGVFTATYTASQVQSFVVPAGVTSITIKAIGANGGTSVSTATSANENGLGGKGAIIQGTFAVSPSDHIYLIVGARGQDEEPIGTVPASGGLSAAGGGGTFVSKDPTFSNANNANLLIAAGGGGGGGYGITNITNPSAGGNEDKDANIVPDGNYSAQTSGQISFTGVGGSNGLTGDGGIGGTNSGGGAGYFSNGTDAGTGAGGSNPSSGAAGGFGFSFLPNYENGGYGGGGATTGGAGGGGGYSGGGGGKDRGFGGGGGSFITGGASTVTKIKGQGTADGNGLVVITWSIPCANAIVPGTIGSPQTICSGSTPALLTSTTDASGGTGTITYQWQSSTDNTNFTDISGATSSTYAPGALTTTTYYRRGAKTATDAVQYTTSVQITVNVLPIVAAGSNSPICAGSALTISSTAGMSSYSWSGPNSFTSSLQNPTVSSSATAAMSGTYTVTVTNANGCSSSSSVTVTVNALPNAPTGTSASACAPNGVTISASGAAGETINWYTAATGGTPVSVGNNFNSNVSGTFYAEAVSAAGCVSATRTAVTATINPLPVITGGASTICINGTTTLIGSGTAAAVNAWVSSNPLVASVDNAGVVTAHAAGNTTITYTNSGGCTASTNILVSGLPGVGILPNASVSICSGSTVTLNSNSEPGLTYSWTPGGSTASSLTVSNAGTYTLTGTNANGCSSSASVTVTVNALPAAPTGTNASACAPNGVTISASGAAGETINWYTVATGGTPVSVGNNLITNVSGTFYAEAVSAAGCVSASRTAVTATINPTPTISGGASTICINGTTTLSGSGTAAAVNAWVSSNPLVASVDNAGVVTAHVAGNTTITYTNSGGCTASTNILVSGLPGVGILANGSTSICAGSSVTLNSNSEPGLTYSWTPGGSTASSLTVSNAGTYTLTGTNANGCSSSASVTVTVNALPAAPTGTNASACAPNGVTISASGAAGETINWYTVATGGTPVSVGNNFITNVSGTFYAEAVSAAGCVSASRTAVTATINPTPTISGGASVICINGTTTLSGSGTAAAVNAWVSSNPSVASVDNAGVVTAHAAGNTTITYTNSGGCTASTNILVSGLPGVGILANGPTSICAGTSVTLNSNSEPGLTYSWTPGGSTASSLTVSNAGTYTLTGTNANGCSSSASVTVTVNALPAAPTGTNASACAPNGVTISASGAAGETINWYTVATGGTPVSVGNNFITNVSGTFYAEAVSAAGCVSASRTAVTATINPTPTISGGASTICINGTTTLIGSGTAAALNAWVSSNPLVASVDNAGVVTAHAAGNTTITYTNSGGCTASTNILVNGLPGVGILPNASVSICSGSSVTLNSNSEPGLTYSWTPGGSTASSLTVSNAGTYTLTGTNANGCSSSASVTVTVNALPNAPTGTDASACAPNGVTISASGAAGETINWYTAATGGTPVSVGNNFITNVSGTFYAEAVSAAGCASAARTAVTATINPLPSATVTPGGATDLCFGGLVVLSAPTGTGYTYQWHLNANDIAGATGSTYTATQAGMYTVTVTTPQACSATTSTGITVTTTLQPHISTGITTFCNGSSSTLQADAVTGVTYQWQKDGTDIPGATGSSYTATAAGSYTLVETKTGGSGCSATSNAILITVNPTPAKPTISGAFTFCSTGSNFTTLTSSAAVSYLWSNGPLSQTTNVNTSGSYFVTITDANGCQNTSDPVTVTANPLPTPFNLTGGGTYCAGGAGVNIDLSGSEAGVNYDLVLSGNTIATLQGTGSAISFTNITAAGSYTIAATNAITGCSANMNGSISVMINPKPIAAISAAGSATVCPGSTVTLNANTGSGYTYQWLMNAVNISGAIGASYQAVTSGSYTVIITSNGCISAASNAVMVTVQDIAAPVAPIIPAINSECGPVTVSAPIATDACAGPITGTTTDATTFTAQGDHVIHWTFTDPSGNASFADQHVIIKDITAPVPNCPSDITVTANTTNGHGLDGANVNYTATATDNCGIPTITYSIAPSSFFPIGTTQVIVTADDGNGNTATCSFNVTVNCVTPVFTQVPVDQTINTTSGRCDAPASYIVTASGIPAANLSYTLSGATTGSGTGTGSGSVFNKGVTMVTVTASNSCGSVSASFNITVEDHESPVIVGLPGNINKSNDAGICGAVVTWTPVSATDNCPVVNLVSDHNSGETFPVGTTTVHYTATDASNNSVSGSFDVTVTDNEVPTFSCPLDINADANTTGGHGVDGYIASYAVTDAHDNCGVASVTYSIPSGSFFPIGNTPVVITVTDIHGNTATCTFNVIVNCVAPVITSSPASQVINTTSGRCDAPASYIVTASGIPAASLSYTFSGATTGSGTGTGSGSVFNKGVTMVTVTASNSCGSVSASFNITVEDHESPVIVGLPGNINKSNDAGICGAQVTWASVSATDNCPVVNLVSDHNPGETFPVGTTTVHYTATDASNNTVSGSFTVTIKDNESPVLTAVPSDISVECDAVPVQATVTSNDNCAVGSALAYQFPSNGIRSVLTHKYSFENNFTDGKGTANGSAAGTVGFVPGIIGNSASFNGSGSYVNLGTAASISGTVNFAVSVWVKTNSSAQQNIIQQRDAGFNGEYILNISANHNGTITVPGAVYFMIYNNGFQFEIFSHSRVDDGKWHHIVAEREGTAGRIFIDGILDGSANGPFTAALTPSIGTYVGRDVRDGTKSFNGQIDELKIIAGASCANTYDLERTWSVKDASGNQAAAQQIVSVQDTKAPLINLPANIQLSAQTGLCSAIATYTATATDNCSSNVTISYSIPSGSSFNVGTTTVAVTAKDACGNTATGNFTVTVTDDEKPTVTCPSDVSVFANTTVNGVSGANVTYGAAITGDNCGVQSTVYSQASGTFFPIGDNVVTVTVTDVHNNVQTCSFHVLVTCVTPVFTQSPSDQIINTTLGRCDAPATYTVTAGGIPAADLSYTFTGATTGAGSGTGSGQVFNKGVTVVTVTATNICGTVSAIFKVTVEDHENPVIVNLPGNINQSNDAGNCGAVVNWPAVSATDNCPVITLVSDHNPGDFFPVGTTTVHYTATDASGNSASGSFTVTVTDNENPIITVPADIIHTADAGKCSFTFASVGNIIQTTNSSNGPGAGPSAGSSSSTAVLGTATGSDNCGNVLITGVRSDNALLDAAYPVGVTTITWTATDDHGHIVTGIQNVTITDDEFPTITAPVNVTVPADMGSCSAASANVILGAPVTGDNCGVNPPTNDAPASFPIGTTIVTWYVTDIHGHTSSATQTVTVIDDQLPVITCPAPITVSCASDVPSANTALVTASDNCTVSVSFAGDVISNQVAPNKYTITRTYKATDLSGNAVTCSQVITVNDDIAPVLTGTLPGGNAGQCYSALPAAPDASAIAALYTDNCSGMVTAVLSNTTTTGNDATGWTREYLYTVSDVSGNTTTASVTYTVKDITPPVVTCPANISALASVIVSGNSGTYINYAATASDNCGPVTVSYSIAPGSFFPVGTTAVTVTATDLAGNQSTCTFHVTVVCVPPSLTVTSIPTNTTYTGGVPTSLYLGYGAQSTTLQANTSVAGNYSYSWSGDGAGMLNSTTTSAPVFTPTKAGNYLFTVVVTNTITGCTGTGYIAICVTDIRVPVFTRNDDDDKQTMCNHEAHDASDCPHKGHNHTCDHQAHSKYNCPHRDTNDRDDTDEKDCDHKAHAAKDCSHVGHNHKPCDHKAHAAKDCDHDKSHSGDDQKVCDHKAHDAANCSHNGHNHAACNHKAHDAKDCPHNGGHAGDDSSDDNGHHDHNGDGEHDKDNGEHDKDNYKVFLCHVPPGNPGKTITLSISINAVAAHLSLHPGDRLGSCDQQPCSGYTDNVKPVIECPGNVTVSYGASTAPTATGAAEASDNSGAVDIIFNDVNTKGTSANLAPFYNYTITRTWRAIDPAGNYSECVQLITVKDISKPVITCPGNKTVTCSSNTGTAVTGVATASDASGAPVTVKNTDVTNGNTITRTWTATDVSGNYSTCTQIITVADNISPVITCVADKVVACGGSTDPYYTGKPTATDNCSAVTISYTDVNCANGVITRTWKATDASGNYSTCVQTISKPVGNPCALPYPMVELNNPRSSVIFNESEILRTTDPGPGTVCGVTPTQIKLWYNDEHPFILGVRQVIVKTKTGTTTTNYPVTAYSGAASTVANPLVGSKADNTSDQSGNDVADAGGRPLRPVLYISDITDNPNNRAGDWQHNGTAYDPNRISGSWKSASRIVDKTRTPAVVSVVPDADPAGKNNWNMGSGGDAAPAGLVNEGYGAEIVWNVASLPLLPGHTYRLQFIVHDGDQNKGGGDAGQACTVIYIPPSTTVTTTEAPKQSATAESVITKTSEEELKVTVMPNPTTTYFTLKFESRYQTPVELRVMDGRGRVVDAKSKIGANSTIQIGHNYSSGTYYAEMIQGTRRKVVQLIKGRG